MNRKNIIFIFCSVAAIFLVYACLQTIKNQSTKQKIKLENPNIIFINIDSLRADHMGIYGYKKNTTPFLDSLFKKGVVFENAIAPAPFTFQDDAAILSGIYPSQNNIIDWGKIINKKIELLPRILFYYGYNSIAFVSPSLWESFGISRFFNSYVVDLNIKNIDKTKISLSNKLKETSSPFFAFWHVYDVHLPFYQASEEFYSKEYKGSLFPLSQYFQTEGPKQSNMITRWGSQTEKGICIDELKDSNGLIQNTCKQYVKVNSEDKEYLIASYDTSIKYVDNQLALFFDSIKNEPFFENTLFIISAEHGEDLGEHGLFFHGDIYNVNTHVPLVFIHPKLKPMRIKETVNTIDIMPTIFSLIGVSKNESIEGVDLSFLLNKEKYEDRPIFSERAPFQEYSVILGDWKYIMRDSSKFNSEEYKNKITPFMTAILESDDGGKVEDELYNLSKDFYEQNNLIGKGYKQEKELFILVNNFKEKMIQAKENQEIDQTEPSKLFIQYP